MDLNQAIEFRKQRVCKRKVKHYSFEAAGREHLRQMRKGLWNKKVYKCDFCGYWHIGGLNEKEERL